MAGAKVPLTFRIFKGDALVREERLSLSVIKLGKVPSAHLKLDDETVSRMHAIIEVNGPGDVSIIDLGSTKGTFVNGQKVNKAKLQSGDTIVVGETKIELAIGASEEESAPVAAASAAPSAPPIDVIASAPRPAVPAPTMQAMAAPPPAAALPLAAPPATPRPAAPAPSAPMMAAPPPVAPPVSAFAPAPAPAPSFRAPPGMPSAQPFATAVAAPAGFAGIMAEQTDIPGAQCVEVVATLDNSVVSAKHCINPDAGRLSGLTIGLWAITAVAFALIVVSWGVSVALATDNDIARHYWTDTLHKPLFAFREKEGSIGWAIIAYNMFWIAIATSFVAAWRTFGELQDPNFTIGRGQARFSIFRLMAYLVIGFSGVGIGIASGAGLALFVFLAVMGPFVALLVRVFANWTLSPWKKADLPVEAPDYALVAARGNDFGFHIMPGMDGEILVGGQSTSFADMLSQGRNVIAPVPQGAVIRARVGRSAFIVKSVPRPRHFFWGMIALLKAWIVANVLLVGSGIVAGAAILLLWILGGEGSSSVGLDMASNEDTSTHTSTTAQDDPPPPPEEDKQDDGKDESGGTGTAMALDEGKMGKKDSTRAEGQYKMKNENVDPQLARQQAIEQARNAGILGSTALVQGGAFASLTGTGDISSGFDESNVYGGLLGNEAGEMNGGFGFGRSGFGPGGGGTGWGTIGTGRYGTIGHGSGTGSGYGVGGGRGGMRGRTAAVPTVSIGQPSANGDLDKAIIRRYIKRNISKITYCYEKQLLAHPGLEGTVQTSFFITPNGTVQSASGQGVDGEVASCVAGVISGIEFPKPKGGGGVQVNYPFTFRPAGS